MRTAALVAPTRVHDESSAHYAATVRTRHRHAVDHFTERREPRTHERPAGHLRSRIPFNYPDLRCFGAASTRSTLRFLNTEILKTHGDLRFYNSEIVTNG